MILVTRLDGTQIYLNAELIQSVESTPDTIIHLTTNVMFLVRESAAVVVEKVVVYQQKVHTPYGPTQG
jgi:flagellar protein FlbD